ITRSPPNFFTPRNLGLELRPLREEPTPFLCAMVSCLPGSAEGDVGNADFGEALPVSLLLRVVLAALHLEHDDLVPEAVLDDLGGDGRALERRHTDLDVGTVRAEEDVIEL